MISARPILPATLRACVLVRQPISLSVVLVVAGCAAGDRAQDSNGTIALQSGGEYLIARPSNYDPKFTWPLVVVCHSGFPDSPKRQIAEWSKLADEQGLIVAALQLERRRTTRGSTEEQAEALVADTRRILQTVEQAQAAHSISPDRVLIYGLGRGASAALHTGLLHPEIFRAVSLNSPLVPGDSLPGTWQEVDPYQPIHVRFSKVDRFHYDRYQALVTWLRSIGANIHVDTAVASDRDRPARAVAFFELLLRKEPWVVITANRADPQNPLSVQFRLQTSLPPGAVQWRFGDGQAANEREPIHSYSQPGTYEVQVNLEKGDSTLVSRSTWLSLPQGTLYRRKPG